MYLQDKSNESLEELKHAYRVTKEVCNGVLGSLLKSVASPYRAVVWCRKVFPQPWCHRIRPHLRCHRVQPQPVCPQAVPQGL